MASISAITKDEQYQVSDITGTSDTTIGEAPMISTTEASSDFSAKLLSALGKTETSQINEEELFSGIIEQQLAELNSDALATFTTTRDTLTASRMRDDGYVPVEEIALDALQATVDSGALDLTTAETINATAFQAAQLDDNHDALYDGRGSENDPTIATSTVTQALSSASDIMAQIESGTLPAQSRDISLAATGGSQASFTGTSGSQELDGPEGFLWKPVSESDGNLVVLLPTELRGLIDKVEIHSSLPPDTSNLLDTGTFAGDTNNGERPHFRFNDPGSSYGENVELVAFMDDGSQLTWSIPNGSERWD